MPSRRTLLATLAAPLLGQGVATRNVKPQPRGKPSGRPFHARFTDIAAQAGLREPTIYGEAARKDYIVEATGCGCAFLDYDRDGWMDILLLGGSRLSGLAPESSLRLYRNRRDGTFEDVTRAAGLIRPGWASAVTVADDLVFVTYWGRNVLYKIRDGRFIDVTRESGLGATDAWHSGCTWIDYDRDGHLDLFVASYVDYDLKTTPKPGENPNCNWKGIPVNCGPRGLKTGRCWLYRNNGDGTFTDVSEKSGVAKARGSYCMTAVAADFDNDGWPDLYVACDSTPSFLFRNYRDGTFREEGIERGVALNEDGMEQAGMGLGIGDANLDGHLDIFKTHFSDDTNVLYLNNAKGEFSDATATGGLEVETRFTGWGAGVADFDNDGLPDLFLATGSVYPEVERALPAYPYRTPRQIFRNLGDARFEQLIATGGPGIEAAHSSRGAAFGDFDNDGDVDILVVNLGEAPSLLRNDTLAPAKGGGHWIKIEPVGPKSLGARVTVRYGGRVQAQEAMASGSYYSANDPRLHFGLGAADKADVEIRWLGGPVERHAGVAVDRMYRARMGVKLNSSGP